MKFINIGPPGGSPSGSLGSMTYSHNRYGYYVRSRSVPTNPNTALQQAVRNTLGMLAALWSSTLTAAQRAAWNLYGDNVVVKDKLGQDIYLTGFNWYVGNNALILQASGTRVDAGPTTFSLADSDDTISGAISESTQNLTLTYDDALDWCDEDGAHLLVYISKPQGAGRNYLPPQYRLADIVDGDSGTPPTSPATIASPWGVAENQRCLVRGVIVRADGRRSAPFHDTVDVGA